jgi:hypothetical protein
MFKRLEVRRLAYSINGKVYTDHALMDEIIYAVKLIFETITLKNETTANENETETSIAQADYFMAIKNGTISLDFFPLTTAMLTGFGYTELQASVYLDDPSKIPTADKESLLTYCSKQFLNDYYEYNNYYRKLNGLPEYFSQSDLEDTGASKMLVSELRKHFTVSQLTAMGAKTASNPYTAEQIYVSPYWVYLDPTNEKLANDDANSDFDFSTPIHLYSNYQINTLESLGILADLQEQYTGSHYSYLRHLGARKIDYYSARSAADWDILYMPDVEYLVKTRFKELYKINRDIYFKRTFQDAYKLQSSYYDEMVMIMVLCQTFTDMIVDTPEWYIRRDVFDLRTVQYFLESQGVEYFKEIPMKYQIRIVKGLNKLIRYKSTTKNIDDILDLFAVEGVVVYHYYLFKKFLYTTHSQTVIIPTTWSLTDMDFGDEETTEDVWVESDTTVTYDFLNEDTDTYDSTLEINDYNFGDEDASTVSDSTDTDKQKEYEESQKIIIDSYGNVYELVFIKVPMGKDYDDYIRDSTYRQSYDSVTTQDPYWDGENVHSYVRNQILAKDFSIAGTKYMSMDYQVPMAKYLFQESYFNGLIMYPMIKTGGITNAFVDNISIPFPSIKPNSLFSLTNIYIALYCLSSIYNNKTHYINQNPYIVNTTAKPDFVAYDIYDGGYPWNGTNPIVPPTPPDTTWHLTDMDFGFEDTDNIIGNSVTTEVYDFGYQYDIPAGTTDIHNYDFGYESDTTLAVANPLYASIELGDEDETSAIVGANPWDGLEKGTYDITLDGGDPSAPFMYRRNIDGGEGRYSVVIQETFYEWMRWQDPKLFVSLTGRIYGFNLKADLTEVAERISRRHSTYAFSKGYTLADLGVDSYISLMSKDSSGNITYSYIESIEQLMNIYKVNTTCYNNLTKLMQSPLSRDDMVTFNYVFNTLFTRPLDMSMYTLKSGLLADTYPQILKERDYSLYSFYYNLTKELDPETRKDNVRDVLNTIIGTLEYYLKGNNTQYIFEFVPTNAFYSVIEYIREMVEFFKSWKVYFLDSNISYAINDDDSGNMPMNSADMMTEIRTDEWYTDNSNIRDNATITEVTA